MSKPKRPRPPKPSKVLWAIYDSKGNLLREPASVMRMLMTRLDPKSPYKFVRVEIRPAPKRKAKRGAK